MTSPGSQLPWLPLAKAAEKVSELTGKHHSEADILRAALAGYLSLSVQLISPVFARPGHFQKYAKDAPHGISANVSLLCAGNGVDREKHVLPEFLGIGDVAFAYSSDQGEYVQGLLDLLLIRNGKAHVQNLERRKQGECEGYFLPSGGIYLKGPTGTFWELQGDVDSGTTHSDDHEIVHTPAERFREDWRIVVRPSELEWMSFHEKSLATTTPVDLPPTTAPPSADHQAADQRPTKKGGRPPSQLYLGIEVLYLKKLAAGEKTLLEPQAGRAFVEELREAVNGPKVCEEIEVYIRKLERRGGYYRIYVQDPPEIDGRPPKSNEKPKGYTTADVSKIMYRLRKKFPLE